MNHGALQIILANELERRGIKKYRATLSYWSSDQWKLNTTLNLSAGFAIVCYFATSEEVGTNVQNIYQIESSKTNATYRNERLTRTVTTNNGCAACSAHVMVAENFLKVAVSGPVAKYYAYVQVLHIIPED